MTRQKQIEAFHAGVRRSLASLGVDPDAGAHDAWLDVGAAARALRSGEPVLLRVAEVLAAPSDAHGSVPRDPWWLLVASASPHGALRAAPLRDGEARALAPTGITLRRERELCCDAPKCAVEKMVLSLWLDLEDDELPELLLGEWLDGEDDAALAALGHALAGRLSLAFDGAAVPPAAVPAEREPSRARAPLPALSLARWALRREGQWIVLRDHLSRGPRELLASEWAMTLVFALGFAAAWVAVWQAWRAQSWELVAIFIAVGGVMTFFTVMMGLIARHSSRYRALSAAVLGMARDRLVVAPWHDRHGAVEVVSGGRYGAAVPLGEVDGIRLVPSRGGVVLRCDTAHGAIDIGTLANDDEADCWREALARWLGATAHASWPARAASSSVATLALLWLAMLASACGPPPSPVITPAPVPTVQSAPVPTAAVPTAVLPTAPTPLLEMIEDDVPAASAKAKQHDKALFVEVWAPWCHTCLSMKNFVLPDPAVVALQDRVVFAAVDSDRPENAAFMDRYEVMAWPTLFVIDPADGEVLGLWQGAASVGELRSFVTDALDARVAMRDRNGPAAALVRAKRAHAAGDWAQAALAYQLALERGGAGWSRSSDARYGALFALYRQKKWRACAERGASEVVSITGAAVPTDYAYVLMHCGGETDDTALKHKAIGAALARLQAHTDQPPSDASVDDKSDALAMLADALSKADPARARRAREKQIALLEAAAARAPSPKEAATFDYARMGAYLALGRGPEAVTLLRIRTQQIPDGYEAHARLAQALGALGQHAEALSSIELAIRHAYGPRQLRYLETKADLLIALGRRDAAKVALEAVLSAYRALDDKTRAHPRNKAIADGVEKRLKSGR